MKLEDAELEQIKNNRQNVEMVALQLGELQLQKVLLDDAVRTLKDNFLQAVKSEEQFLETIKEKYGDGLLDIETGEIKINNGE